MTKHLRFDAKTGQIETRTLHGKHTEELLQLNDDARVNYRLSTLRIVRLLTSEIEQLELQLKSVAGQLSAGLITQADYDTEEQAINQDLAGLHDTVAAQTGKLPLPPLQKNRLGVTLIKP